MSDLHNKEIDTRKYLAKQTILLHSASIQELDGRFANGFVLLASAVTTLGTINELALNRDQHSSDILILSRAALEKLANYMYSTICSEEEYERFHLYPYYRSYHNLKRHKHTKSDELTIEYSGKKSIESMSQYAAALRVFSKDNPRLRWARENRTIDERLAYISEKTGYPAFTFLLNSLLIYNDASEAIHGSLYGAVGMLGVYDPPFSKNGKEANIRIREKLAMLYLSLGEMGYVLLSWISKNHAGSKKLKQLYDHSSEARRVVYSMLDK